MLEGAIYFLLKKHFRKEAYYVDLLELFHDVRAGDASGGAVLQELPRPDRASLWPPSLRSPSRPSSGSSST